MGSNVTSSHGSKQHKMRRRGFCARPLRPAAFILGDAHPERSRRQRPAFPAARSAGAGAVARLARARRCAAAAVGARRRRGALRHQRPHRHRAGAARNEDRRRRHRAGAGLPQPVDGAAGAVVRRHAKILQGRHRHRGRPRRRRRQARWLGQGDHGDQLLRLSAGPGAHPRLLRPARPADAGRLRALLLWRTRRQAGRLVRRLRDRQQHEIFPQLRGRLPGLGAPFAGAGGAALGRRRLRAEGRADRAGKQFRLRPPGRPRSVAAPAAEAEVGAVGPAQGAPPGRAGTGAGIVRQQLQLRSGVARQALVVVFAPAGHAARPGPHRRAAARQLPAPRAGARRAGRRPAAVCAPA